MWIDENPDLFCCKEYGAMKTPSCVSLVMLIGYNSIRLLFQAIYLREFVQTEPALSQVKRPMLAFPLSPVVWSSIQLLARNPIKAHA